MNYKYFYFLLIILFACNVNKENKATSYEKYIKPILLENNIENYEGGILAISNTDCNACVKHMQNNSQEFSNFLILYDSTIYPNSHFLNSIKMGDDKPSRIKTKNKYGHKLYFIKNDNIIKIIKITPKNVKDLNFSK